MDKLIKNRYRNALFFFLIFSIIFDNIPKFARLNFLAGPLGHGLVFYPVLLGVFYTFYNRDAYLSPIKKKGIGVFILTYCFILFISFLHGFIHYPYYDLLVASSGIESHKFIKVQALISKLGLNISESLLVCGWLSARNIKGIFLDALYTFFGSFMIYCWYKNDLEKAFKIFVRASFVGLLIFLIYGYIDVLFQVHVPWAQWILETVNPLLHTIQEDYDWWPPLLWKNQVRSVFSEPSRVGNYAAMLFPLLSYLYLSSKSKKKTILIGMLLYLFVNLIFLTQARTAVGMLVGMFGVLVFLLLFLHSKKYWKKGIQIILIAALSFITAVSIITMEHKLNTGNSEADVSYEEFVENNLNTLSKENARSNGARYGLLRAHIAIGKDHLLLGVGRGLGSAYMPDYFDERAKNDKEIQMWLRGFEEKGVMQGGMGAMNEYVDRFSSTGLLGLGVYLLPFMYAVIRLFIRLIQSKQPEVAMYHAWSLMFLISTMAAGFNGSNTLLYCLWIALAFAYLDIRNEDSSEDESA